MLAESQNYELLVSPEELLTATDIILADLAGTPMVPFHALERLNPRLAIEALLLINSDSDRTQGFRLPGLSNFADGLLQSFWRGLE